MKITVCISVLAALILSACKVAPTAEELKYNSPDYPETVRRTIVPVNRDLLLGNVMSLELCDSLVIMRAQSVDNGNVFHAVSVADGRVEGSFCNIGRGDKELTDYSRTAFDRDKKRITGVDNTCRIVDIDVAKAIAGDIDYVSSERLTGSRNTTSRILVLDDGLLHVEGFTDRYFITDHTLRDTLVRYDDYPLLPKNTTAAVDTRDYFSMNSHSAIKPDRTRFVNVTHYGMILEIFEIGDDGIERIAIRRFFEPKMQNRISCDEDCVWGATGIYATDRYIYITYYDTADPANSGRRMGIFDWDGNAVCLSDFDCTIRQFAVTPDDRRVYCWVQDADAEEYFGYFDLK